VEGPSLDALGADTGMRVLLTDRFCDRAKSTSAQTDYFDESVSGLALRERFRHGTRLLRWRPDKAPKQCTIDQIKQKKAKLMALLD